MSRRWDDPHLKELQKFWYDKLKSSGFKDIEDVNSPKEYLRTFEATWFCSQYTPETFKMKEDYYRMCSHFLYEYRFRNPLYKKVWEYHADGISFRNIVKLLEKEGIKTNKDRINQIVRRLALLMRRFQFSQ